jgi:pimeloyl-ACP methyl ester carboxylesterase
MPWPCDVQAFGQTTKTREQTLRLCVRRGTQLDLPLAMSSATTKNMLPAGTLRMGSGEPLVLLHGVLGASLMWRHVMPLLATQHSVIALAALGHQGGHPSHERPTRIQHVVDDAERALDALGLQRVHLAGNSMGGWVALELCRRGRARSVCALSPAGMWDASNRSRSRLQLQATLKIARMTRPLLRWGAGSAAIRRLALRDCAVHGERTSPSELIALADAMLECAVAEGLLSTTEQFAELSASCPTTVAWSACDRIFPLVPFADSARRRVLGAQHLVLDDVGHVPMLDNPRLVADTILDTTAQTRDRAAATDSR